MATKKTGFNFTNVIAAAGGGAVVNMGLDMLEDKVEMFQDKPILGPALFEVVGIAATYFGEAGSPIAAAGQGMIGAATAELMSLQKEKSSGGFSRVNVNKSRFMNKKERETLRDRFRNRAEESDMDDDDNH